MSHEKIYMYRSPNRSEFLGVAAVAASRTLGEDNNRQEVVSREIAKSAAVLRSISEPNRLRVSEKLDEHLPGSLNRLTVLSMPKGAFGKNTDDDWVSYLASADESTLLSFLAWHNDAVEFQQSSELLKKTAERHKRLFLGGLDRGVSEGWLSSDVLTQKEIVARTRVRLADYFDALFLDGAGGMYDFVGEQLLLPQGRPTQDMKKVFNHEMLHPFMMAQFGPWLEELTVDTAAMWMSGAKTGVIDFNVGGYRQDKLMAFMLTTRGRSDIDPTLLTRLASSCSSDEHDSCREELAKQEQRAWGIDGVFEALDTHITGEIRDRQLAGSAPLAAHRDAVSEVLRCFGSRDYGQQRARLPGQLREIAEHILHKK